MELEEFINFLRSGYDYGTGDMVPFKETLVEKIQVLMEEYPPEPMELLQLANMTNLIKSAIKTQFANKDYMIADGELDFTKASVYDFVFAYVMLARAYLENRLLLIPVFNMSDNKLEFYDSGGIGAKKFEMDLPEGFYAANYIARAKLHYNQDNNCVEIYIYTRPADDTFGESAVVYNSEAEQMPYGIDFVENLSANSREMVVEILEENKTAIVSFLNQYPRCKRAINKLRTALELPYISGFNISGVFANGLIEAVQLVIDEPSLLENFHSCMTIPDGIKFVKNNPDSCAFHFVNKYTPISISCDEEVAYPYLCKVTNGNASKLDGSVYMFNGTAFVE